MRNNCLYEYFCHSLCIHALGGVPIRGAQMKIYIQVTLLEEFWKNTWGMNIQEVEEEEGRLRD